MLVIMRDGWMVLLGVELNDPPYYYIAHISNLILKKSLVFALPYLLLSIYDR
jgi:hypothetical protein